VKNGSISLQNPSYLWLGSEIEEYPDTLDRTLLATPSQTFSQIALAVLPLGKYWYHFQKSSSFILAPSVDDICVLMTKTIFLELDNDLPLQSATLQNSHAPS
jgi:hypothetical protein